MNSYLVSLVETYNPARETPSGIVTASKEERSFVKGFRLVEAEDPNAAVEEAADNVPGRYVVIEVEARSVKTVVVE